MEIIKLSDNKLSHNFGSSLGTAIISGKWPPSLHTIELVEINLMDIGLKHLAEVLEKGKQYPEQLKRVDLRCSRYL